jgi:ADP-dependent NAD(P)H-hydrate dehydratase
VSKDAVLGDPQDAAAEAAREWNAVVALKGAVTLIAAPDGRGWRHEGGHAGLATSVRWVIWRANYRRKCRA